MAFVTCACTIAIAFALPLDVARDIAPAYAPVLALTIFYARHIPPTAIWIVGPALPFGAVCLAGAASDGTAVTMWEIGCCCGCE